MGQVRASALRSTISKPSSSSTRGLDASTAVEFVRALRIATDTFRLTTIVSIYQVSRIACLLRSFYQIFNQAGESLYQMFDKVCLVYDGKMAYFGPADQARQYFIDMGYEPADRQTTADFLVAVTDPKGRIARTGVTPPPPNNAAEFEDYYQKSAIKQQNRDGMAAYRKEFVGQPDRVSAYRQSAWAEHAKHTRTTSSYTISIPMQVRAVMARRVQILKGSWGTQVIQAL
jgi:ATP-binding cassette subfamily G (WHITE) protein 2 (SNQ2)